MLDETQDSDRWAFVDNLWRDTAAFAKEYFPGVNPADWIAIGGASLVLILVAVIASYLPARRAARVNPLLALRQD